MNEWIWARLSPGPITGQGKTVGDQTDSLLCWLYTLLPKAAHLPQLLCSFRRCKTQLHRWPFTTLLLHHEVLFSRSVFRVVLFISPSLYDMIIFVLLLLFFSLLLKAALKRSVKSLEKQERNGINSQTTKILVALRLTGLKTNEASNHAEAQKVRVWWVSEDTAWEFPALQLGFRHGRKMGYKGNKISSQ